MLSGDMGKVEENTRYTAIGIIGPLGVIDLLWKLDEHFWRLLGIVVEIKDDVLGKITAQLDILLTEHTEKIRDYCLAVKDSTARLVASFQQPAQITINIDGNVIGNQEFIDQLTEAIGKKLRLSAAT